MKASSNGFIATSIRTAPRCRVAMPSTVAELGSILATPGSVIVAGGTDLCAQFNEGLKPALIVGVNRVAELHDIQEERNELRIGGRHHRVRSLCQFGDRVGRLVPREGWRESLVCRSSQGIGSLHEFRREYVMPR